MIFDPIKNRWAYTNNGGLKMSLAVREILGKPIGNYAIHDIQDVIYAWLARLEIEISPAIPRALDWLNQAIKGKEKFGESQNFHHMRLHWARAISKWLLSAETGKDDWAEAMRFELDYWKDEPNTATWTIRHCLDDYMAFALQAGRYAEGIETYERLVGVKKVPLSKILKPRDYAYALCLQQTQGQFNDEDLFEAGRRVLQANLKEEWLGRGQSIRAATWLKIVYWDRDLRAGRAPVLTPLQALLKAYDDMPNVPRPDFLASEG